MNLNKIDLSILHLAANYNFLALFSFLIKDLGLKGETLDRVSKADRTPLMTALIRGHFDLAKFLIEEGKCDYKRRG